jgi:hypothetical protein
MACEQHIYKDGQNLASLAGGILLEIRSESFIVTCHVMNELLGALSFRAMNRILNKARNRMVPETLMQCMMISIEGPEIPTDEFLNRVVYLYATKKPRRIRFL